ncbi:glycosyltransferase family 2 protein [Clostridium diolis]|uniref:glycosyltransferase family 2 protein n=1 Tax=Clostridium diolis TaxID=223919 RepID=UPI003AF7A391
MKKVTFVILHYMALKETKECIESILNNVDYNNYKIVIVDNKSPNNTGIQLKDIYFNNNRITVILSDKNLGFAQGNNLGYIYAKETLKSDFIILINNDTIIKQSEFINIALNTFNKEPYHVLGPDIISTQGQKLHQNPVRLVGVTKKELKKRIRNIKIKYAIQYFIFNTKSEKLFEKFNNISKKLIKIKKEDDVNTYHLEKRENVQLHGACIILSSLYIEHFDYAFYPKTYMYMEEDILYYLCKKNRFKTIYNPEMKIYHKEDASTDMLVKSNIKKMIFVLKHSKDSANVLYELMNEK